MLIVGDDEAARPLSARARPRASRASWRTRGDAGLALAHEHRPDAIVLAAPAATACAAARAAQADPRHAPHAGAASSATGARASDAAAAGAAVPGRAGRRRGARRGAAASSPTCGERTVQAACSSSTTTRPSGAHRRADRRRRRRGRRASAPARRRSRRSTTARFDCIVLDLKLPEGVGLRAARAGQGRPAPPRRAGDHPHRQGADPARGDAPEALRRDDRRQGRRARPSGCWTRRRCTCTGRRGRCPTDSRRMLEQMHDADAALARAQGADRRRRRAQRVRAHQRARGARDGRRCSPRTAARRSSDARRPRRRRPRPDGHHDAGDGRLRDDDGDPRACPSSSGCRSSP